MIVLQEAEMLRNLVDLGSWTGLVLYYLKGKTWKISKTNIQLCFPELTPPEQEAIL